MSRKQRKAKARRAKRKAGYAHPTKNRAGSPGETYMQAKARKKAEAVTSGFGGSGV